MPIEFPCAQCGNLLRTPDDTAGKQAKCPDCGGLTRVPTPTQQDAPPQVTTPGGGSPFAQDPGATAPRPHEAKPTVDPANPYASSVGYSPETGAASSYAYGAQTTGELKHQYLDFGELLNTTWSSYTAQLGMGLLFALIVTGINMGMQFVGFGLGIVQEVLKQNDLLPVAVLLMIAQQVLALLVSVFVTCLSIKFGLNVLRGHRAPLTGIFDVGASFLPVLGFFLLMGLVVLLLMLPGIGLMIGGAAAAAGGGEETVAALLGIGAIVLFAGVIAWIVIILKYSLVCTFIIDRQLGVFDAMRASSTFMSGNMLTVFLMNLVVGIVAMFFIILTCGLGALFVTPYMAILWAAVYLIATGQLARGAAPQYSPA